MDTKYKMKLFSIILLTFIGILTYAQNNAYYVKQTQVSFDMETFTPLKDNLLFTKVVVKSNGIELTSSNKEVTFIHFNEINKVDEGAGFRYELPPIDEITTALFFNPYPYKTSEPRLYMAILSVPGLDKDNPRLTTFFRLVYIDDLLK